MLLHYLAKVRNRSLANLTLYDFSSRAGKAGFHSSRSVTTEQSWPRPYRLYKIWGIIQQQFCQSWVHNIDELKQRLLHVWHRIDHTVIDNAINEWRRCLWTCVRAKDRHFKQLLWQYSDIWRDISVFVKCDTYFRFFCKLPQIQCLNWAGVWRSGAPEVFWKPESWSGAPELLGRSKAERRAFCLLGYVCLISLCLDEPCRQTVAVLWDSSVYY